MKSTDIIAKDLCMTQVRNGGSRSHETATRWYLSFSVIISHWFSAEKWNAQIWYSSMPKPECQSYEAEKWPVLSFLMTQANNSNVCL